MDRRYFLKSSCLTFLSFLNTSYSAVVAQNSKKEKDKPLFTFIQLTDTHISAPFSDKSVYAGANERMRWFIKSLETGAVTKPDFILHTGDMIHGEHLEKLGPDLEEFDTNVLKNICVQFYPCVGNHENVQRAGVAAYEEAYIRTFGPNKLNYTFEHGGIVFVVFDNSSDPPGKPFKELHEKLRRQRNEWLRKVFAGNQKKPKILCCHIPVVSLREEAVLKRSFGFCSWKSHDEELIELLSANKETILAVLSGHLHLTGCVKVDGIYHIVPSGLASYPHDFAVYKVYSGRIDVCMSSVPQELSEPYRSNIHCSRRHGIDYVDKEHSTHELYMSGNHEERVFSMLLQRLDN